MSRMGKLNSVGFISENEFSQMCMESKATFQRMPLYAPFDFVVNGWRIETKAAELRVLKGTHNKYSYQGFQFNIHRHNVLSEECDFYALNFRDGKDSSWALLAAPLNRKTLRVLQQTLLHGYYKDGEARLWRLLRGELGIGTFDPTPEELHAWNNIPSMGRKLEKPTFLQDESFRKIALERLKAKVVECGTQAKAALALKVNPQYLSHVINGHREIGPKVLRQLGFERVPPSYRPKQEEETHATK
jgi:hypothetical protein